MDNFNMHDITDAHKEILHGMSFLQLKHRSKIHNGHEIFKVNINDGTITKIPFIYDSNKVVMKYEMGYVYITALNEANAKKKFIKILSDIDRKLKNSTKSNVNSESSSPLTLEGNGELDTGQTKSIP